jgi:hypothetical protein
MMRLGRYVLQASDRCLSVHRVARVSADDGTGAKPGYFRRQDQPDGYGPCRCGKSGFHSSPLQAGDLVAVRCHFDDKSTAVADSIEANIGRWEGFITKIVKDTVYIKFDSPVKGSAAVTFDSSTEFGYCAGDDPQHDCTIGDLKVGRHLETVGFIVGKGEMRATRVLGIQKH